MRQRLRLVAAWLDEHGGPAARSQWSFDAGWLADRAVARRSGLGVYGDNSSIVVPGFGSWVLLGAVITSVHLPADPPAVGRCDQCGACLSACPTGALVAPGMVDATRCVSYLTVELAGSIPPDLRSAIGNRLVGCDTCQDVCPHNRGAAPATVPDLLTPLGIGASPDSAELLALSAADFDRRFRGTVVWRLGRDRLARNAAVVLGNVGGPGAVAALAGALSDPSALVREHAAWALRRLGGSAADDSPGAAHSQPVHP
jgi:epoxyqueuosine reductase